LRKRPVWERTRAAAFGGTGHDNFAAGVAAFRAEIDHVVVGLDDIEVVLDDDHCVPGVIFLATTGS
jgi:hypothetical protein